MSSRISVFALLVMMVAVACVAQVAPAAPATSPASVGPAAAAATAFAVDNNFIQKQFGSTCKIAPGFAPQTADLDGDGVEDAVLVGHCSNPMMDQEENNFRVVDPYNGFFGYGDPKVTSQFANEDPERRGLVLLIIHGAGAEGWRSEQPKAKFVIINLPFKQIALRKFSMKKKQVMAIYAEEDSADRMSSTLFWDGKKYRYQPMGSTLD